MPAAWWPKAPISSTSARNRPAPMAARSRCRPEEELRRLEPILPAVLDPRRPGLDRHHEGDGRRLGARCRRRHRQRRLGPAARSRHGPRGRRARRAGDRHAQPRGRRSGDRHHGRHRGVLLPFARDRRPRRHRARQDRARSRHRLRQDAGAEHHRPRPAGGAEVVRAAAPGRRLAQALHRQRLARPARPPDRRLDRQPSVRGRERRRHRPRPRRRRDRAGAEGRRRHPRARNDATPSLSPDWRCMPSTA